MANDIGHFEENCCHVEAGNYGQRRNLIDLLWIVEGGRLNSPMMEASSHLLCRARVLGPRGPLHSIQSVPWFMEIRLVSGKWTGRPEAFQASHSA